MLWCVISLCKFNVMDIDWVDISQEWKIMWGKWILDWIDFFSMCNDCSLSFLKIQFNCSFLISSLVFQYWLCVWHSNKCYIIQAKRDDEKRPWWRWILQEHIALCKMCLVLFDKFFKSILHFSRFKIIGFSIFYLD
jgi:hypothetical protein